MIVFDLVCSDANHVFEGWFGSSEDYEDQRRRGLLTCPMCGSVEIAKAVMAPRVGAKGNRASEPAAQSATPAPGARLPMANGEASAAAMKGMLAALAKAQTEALAGSDYVGPRFAAEARAIHLGESVERPIYGQASPEEAKALADEGIPVAPLPFPVRPPGTDN